VTVDVREVRAGRVDVAALHARHRFDAVVFDIALPYQANWQLFKQLRATDLAGVPTVLTTTNERALDALIDEEHPEVVEIWGKPYDTERLRARVHAVLDLANRRTSSEDRRRMGTGSPLDRRDGERRRTVRGAALQGCEGWESSNDASGGVSGMTKRLTTSRS
jgi:DNA-binding response OmpR family regulator